MAAAMTAAATAAVAANRTKKIALSKKGLPDPLGPGGPFLMLQRKCLRQCARNLIGAGSGLHAATNSLAPCNHILRLHAGNQRGNPLQVAVTPADYAHPAHRVAIKIDNNLAGTCPFCFVMILHLSNLLFLILLVTRSLQQCRQLFIGGRAGSGCGILV